MLLSLHKKMDSQCFLRGRLPVFQAMSPVTPTPRKAPKRRGQRHLATLINIHTLLGLPFQWLQGYWDSYRDGVLMPSGTKKTTVSANVDTKLIMSLLHCRLSVLPFTLIKQLLVSLAKAARPQGGSPLYRLCRYAPHQRVCFFSCFGPKQRINFDHFGLKQGMVCALQS